jgi:hypothetical protein
MNFTRLEDIVRVQDEFLQKLGKSPPGAARAAAVSELVTRDRAATVEAIKRRLEALGAGRQAAIRRFDDEIARLGKALADLEAAPPKGKEAPPPEARASRRKKTS